MHTFFVRMHRQLCSSKSSLQATRQWSRTAKQTWPDNQQPNSRCAVAVVTSGGMGKQTPADSTVLLSAEHQHTQMTCSQQDLHAGCGLMANKCSQALWAHAMHTSAHDLRITAVCKSAAASLLPVPMPYPWASNTGARTIGAMHLSPLPRTLTSYPALELAILCKSVRATTVSRPRPLNNPLDWNNSHLCRGPHPFPSPCRALVLAPRRAPSCRWCQQCDPHPALAAWPESAPAHLSSAAWDDQHCQCADDAKPRRDCFSSKTTAAWQAMEQMV